MTLRLHRSERADRLVDGLAAVLGVPPSDPFTPEVVAVPARGVERWLTQRLAHRLGESGNQDGVAANIDFRPPARLVRDVVTAARGRSGEPGDDPGAENDPWSIGTVWRLLEVVDASVEEPWCAPLAQHLSADGARRFATVRRLAGLFGSYGAQRPQLLRDWRAGRDTDGAGGTLGEDLHWQAELWRRLRTAIGEPSPAERLDEVCGRVRDEPGVVDLPARLSVFGPTRLTSDQVAVLSAVAERRDVHLWLPHPSAALWDRLSGAAPGGRTRRRLDLRARSAAHPLLSSLGRDSREMQLLLAEAGSVAGGRSTGTRSDEHHPVDPAPATLLGLVQHGLRSDDPPPGPPLGGAVDARPAYDPTDRSLQVHACHGRARQVEVLREVLLGLLAADPTLEPRDVLVMCPDIESYAPLISATFGLGDAADGADPSTHPGHRLRVRLADRSLRRTNPLLGTIARLLDLADARVTASQVLDLAAYPPVRRRFRLDEEDLERLREWVSTSGVRWGLSAQHRAPYRMDGVAQNTWQAGLDRVLVGVAMAEDELRWLGLALPLDDVDSGDIDLAGRFAELVDRLATSLAALGGVQPLSGWLAALHDALGALTSVGDRDAWQLAQVQRELGDVATDAGERVDDVRLSLDDVRVLLADLLEGRPTRAGFRTGNLTMCSMVPMRSVPHRVICVLGLDDGVFPRTSGVDGDDVLARDPLVGERDRRSEDRQLLLDAVLAAEEHLVMVYTGADERTNTVRPPAVPLGEILDVVDATVRTAGARPAREHVVVRHPLQPFDARNFTAGAMGAREPFSFDAAALAGARAATQRRAHPHDQGRGVELSAFLGTPLPALEAPSRVELDLLVRFLEHPVRGFLRQRLGVSTPEPGEELDDALQAELDGLARWFIGDRWLHDRLAGAGEGAAEQAEWRRGALPPGALGVRSLRVIADKAEALVAAGEPVRVGAAAVHDVAVALPGGHVLTGSVGGVHDRTLTRTVYSRLAAKHRIRAWVQLLALAAAYEDVSWRAVTVGGNGKDGVARAVLDARSPDRARMVLSELVDLHARGLREPLPLPLAASLAYAELRHLGDSEDEALQRAAAGWRGGFEATDPDHETVWGPAPSFTTVCAHPPDDADQPPAATEREGTRFGALACQLWFPMLGAETLELS